MLAFLDPGSDTAQVLCPFRRAHSGPRALVEGLLPAFAAAFLGTTQLKPGRFNVWGTLLAICLLGTGVQGLQLAGADLWVTDVFNGVALIGAISIALLMQRLRGKREVKATEAANDPAQQKT